MLDPVLLNSVTAVLVILMLLLLVSIWRKVKVLAETAVGAFLERLGSFV